MLIIISFKIQQKYYKMTLNEWFLLSYLWSLQSLYVVVKYEDNLITL